MGEGHLETLAFGLCLTSDEEMIFAKNLAELLTIEWFY
mgnify:CR=1 FL=1